ncbi:3-oxoacyl-[acyl-carrier-protein] reductase FabG [Falsiruegeria litorea R37]|uniref:3-oxoacyl-[acyl-carrier-protein] reductase FabG n=1 Tax=Falsiruegeria litorea R37 TaxID=1200284 RepID=A0A1Y5RSF2_9RHOB|nr:SDR family oxidoreductase [Falsiruegeria litorea]SLN24346.1 3-oxoacyl-[acyl-carrier-protein] reductase FabG [Falsiruegeria litorea R37]
MISLAGQVVLITGASAPRGIGRAIAKRLAQDGARVVVTDIDGALEVDGQVRPHLGLLQDLAAQIGGLALKMDVTDPEQIAVCLDETRAKFGPVDVLVNNAGSLAGSDNFLSTTPAQWQASFAVNLLGPMQLAQAVIPDMQAKGSGRIINIGSTGSLGAEAGFGAYTAMKHGLVGLSKTLAAEFGPDGILCNTVCSGYIATDMHMAANARLSHEKGVSLDEIKRRRYSDVALRDAGSPEDVAEAVAYLVGPAGRYVTGINLPVTGGVPFGI